MFAKILDHNQDAAAERSRYYNGYQKTHKPGSWRESEEVSAMVGQPAAAHPGIHCISRSLLCENMRSAY